MHSNQAEDVTISTHSDLVEGAFHFIVGHELVVQMALLPKHEASLAYFSQGWMIYT
jgi:hypothetical protein